MIVTVKTTIPHNDNCPGHLVATFDQSRLLWIFCLNKLKTGQATRELKRKVGV